MSVQPRLTGTFFDFQHVNQWDAAYWCDECRFWKEENWRELVRESKRAGFDTLIATGSGFWGRPFFGGYEKTIGRQWKMGCSDPIGVTVDEAAGQDMKIFLGIGFRGRICQVNDYSRMAPPWDPAWFTWNSAVAGALMERFSDSPAFAGLYIGTEIYCEDPVQIDLYEKLVKKHLRPVIGDKVKILISPSLFSVQNPDMNKTIASLPAKFERIGVDIIAPQDLGGRLRDPDQAVALAGRSVDGIAHAREVLKDSGLEWWINCELFDSAPSPDGRIYCVPGPFDRIRRQMEMAAPVADKLICYQFQGLMNRHTELINIGAPETDKLYAEYMQYIRN